MFSCRGRGANGSIIINPPFLYAMVDGRFPAISYQTLGLVGVPASNEGGQV